MSTKIGIPLCIGHKQQPKIEIIISYQDGCVLLGNGKKKNHLRFIIMPVMMILMNLWSIITTLWHGQLHTKINCNKLVQNISLQIVLCIIHESVKTYMYLFIVRQKMRVLQTLDYKVCFKKNGYTFAIVYSSKCVTVFSKQTLGYPLRLNISIHFVAESTLQSHDVKPECCYG